MKALGIKILKNCFEIAAQPAAMDSIYQTSELPPRKSFAVTDKEIGSKLSDDVLIF